LRQRLGDVTDDYQPDEDDEDDEGHGISATAVRELNFGGGLVRKRTADGDEEGPARHRSEPPLCAHRRSHKEIMEEVIAKSKMHKLERQEEKRV